MKKRILSLALALCLLVSLLATPILAADSPSYVALGDSIAAGYGLEGFAHITGDPGSLTFTVPAGCFANLVGRELGYEVNNLAVSGDDTAALLQRMETAQYSEPLKQADLITLTIGSNDLLVTTIELLVEHFGWNISDHAELAVAGEGSLLGGDLTSVMATLQEMSSYMNSAEFTAKLDAAVEGFKTNWDTIISTLQAWNPDARVVVTNYYHPYAAFNYSFGTLNLNIGTLGQGYLDQLNAYITESPYNGTYYTIVDVTKTTTNVKLDTTALVSAFMGGSLDLASAINLDPHPDAAGHEYFAQQLLAELVPQAQTTAAAPTAQAAADFPDVAADAWYAVPVGYAAEQNLVIGDAQGNFNPDDTMTVAQYMTVLYRYARAAVGASIPEKATSGENWLEAAQYLNQALLGGKFKTLTDPMTRYEMADITAAVLKLVAGTTDITLNTRTTHGFADVADNENVAFLESVYGIDGIAQADGTYLFEGDSTITRAQVAQVVYNIMTKSAA